MPAGAGPPAVGQDRPIRQGSGRRGGFPECRQHGAGVSAPRRRLAQRVSPAAQAKLKRHELPRQRQRSGVDYPNAGPSPHRLAAKVSQWLNGTASLEFWIKTKQRGEGGWNAPAVFGADSNGDGNDLFWGTNYGGRVGLRRGDSGPVALTPEPIHDNHWHHVVLIRDHESGVMKAYLDGRLVDTYQDASSVSIKTTYGTIGQIESLPGKGQKLMATLDEVAIYD